MDHHVLDLDTNFLQKPYSLRQLGGKIRAALDLKKGKAAGHSGVVARS
jgi:hypothetical protein